MFSIMLLLLWTIFFATTVLAQGDPPNCADFLPDRFIDDPSDCSAYWYCLDPTSEPTWGQCEVGNFNEADQTCDIDFPCDDETTTEETTTEETTTEETTTEETTIEETITEETTTPEDPGDPEPTTTPTPPTNVCEGLPDGRFVNNPTRCRSYFLCMNEVPLPRQCDMGLNFNEELQICDRPTFTPCENEEFECPFIGISRWEQPGSCKDYNFCFGGEHRLQTCAEGLQFNTDISLCALEESFACTRDRCPLDNNEMITFPSENDCEQYYLCYNGNLELQFCAAGTHWNQDRRRCERPEDAQCELSTIEPPTTEPPTTEPPTTEPPTTEPPTTEPPTTEPTTEPPTTEPPTIDCPDEDGLSFLPNPNDCQYYFICVARQPFPQRCADGTLFDSLLMRCVVADQAICPDVGERTMLFMNLISRRH